MHWYYQASECVWKSLSIGVDSIPILNWMYISCAYTSFMFMYRLLFTLCNNNPASTAYAARPIVKWNYGTIYGDTQAEAAVTKRKQYAYVTLNERSWFTSKPTENILYPFLFFYTVTVSMTMETWNTDTQTENMNNYFNAAFTNTSIRAPTKLSSFLRIDLNRRHLNVKIYSQKSVFEA